MEKVHVCFRFRGGEDQSEFAPIKLQQNRVIVSQVKNPFNLDAAISPEVNQEEVYNITSRHIVNQYMEGYNGTIFAYGQSGSGKTFTMMGPEKVTEALMQNIDEIQIQVQELFGIIPRAVMHIFELINQGIQKEQIKYQLSASYVEIYNEQVNDIMCCPIQKNLKIREIPQYGPTVIGLSQRSIVVAEEIFECIAMGTANKKVASTNQNSRSSRSHTLFIIELEQKFLSGTVKRSRINLVDLAGSERISKTGAEGQTLEEAKKINLSLTTLGRVIKALTDPKEKFVPYRESKLTIILKESLGGNSKTALICTASMKQFHLEETINTLRFAERAKLIVCNSKANIVRSPAEFEKLIEQLKQEIQGLRKKLIDGGQLISEGEEEFKDKYLQIKAEYEEFRNNTVMEIEILKDQVERAQSQTSNIDLVSAMEKEEFLNDQLDELRNTIVSLQLGQTQTQRELEDQIMNLTKKNQEENLKMAQMTKELKNQDQMKNRDKYAILTMSAQFQELQMNFREVQKQSE